MKAEQTHLVNVLRQIAYDAGCALLGSAEPETTRRCAARYNRVCARLRQLDPTITSVCACLPEDASPGSVRMAARTAALRAEDAFTGSLITRLAA
ncbi:MAG: hypothetical protein ACE5G0_05165 [Rhodothermales bacterium]